MRALQGRTTRFTKLARLPHAGYRFPQLAGCLVTPEDPPQREEQGHSWVGSASGLRIYPQPGSGLEWGKGDRKTMTQLGLPTRGPQGSTGDFPVPISNMERGRVGLSWSTTLQGYRRGQNELKGHRDERREDVGRGRRQRVMWSGVGAGLPTKGPAYSSLSPESYLAAFLFSVEG